MTKDYCNRLLLALLGSPDLVDRWWTSPNKGFDNKQPCEVPLADVASYLEGYCFG